MITYKEKATRIWDKLNGNGICSKKQKERSLSLIEEELTQIEEEYPTRTLKEVQGIVDCVRAGVPVQIDYADEEDSEYVYKACW